MKIKPRVIHDVHMHQLKPFVEDVVSGKVTEMFHFMGGYQALDTQPDEWDVEETLKHRRKKDRTWKFLT